MSTAILAHVPPLVTPFLGLWLPLAAGLLAFVVVLLVGLVALGKGDPKGAPKDDWWRR